MYALYFNRSLRWKRRNCNITNISCSNMLLIFLGGGKLGVNCFILLTGYFAGTSCQTGKRIVKLWCQVLFYSWLSLLLFFLFSFEEISGLMIKQTIFPIVTEVYWFATNYVFLCFLLPFLIRLIGLLEQSVYKKMLCILFGGFCVLPSFFYRDNPFFSNIGWFVCLFCLGFYINKYLRFHSIKLEFLIFILSWMSMWILDMVIQKMFLSVEVNYFSYMYRIPMLTASVSLFCMFKDLKLGCRNGINQISKGVFGVYLLHDSLYFRRHFWKMIHAELYYNTFLFLGHMLFWTGILFGLGLTIDCLREQMFVKLLYRTKVYCRIVEKLNDWMII